MKKFGNYWHDFYGEWYYAYIEIAIAGGSLLLLSTFFLSSVCNLYIIPRLNRITTTREQLRAKSSTTLSARTQETSNLSRSSARGINIKQTSMSTDQRTTRKHSNINMDIIQQDKQSAISLQRHLGSLSDLDVDHIQSPKNLPRMDLVTASQSNDSGNETSGIDRIRSNSLIIGGNEDISTIGEPSFETLTSPTSDHGFLRSGPVSPTSPPLSNLSSNCDIIDETKRSQSCNDIDKQVHFEESQPTIEKRLSHYNVDKISNKKKNIKSERKQLILGMNWYHKFLLVFSQLMGIIQSILFIIIIVLVVFYDTR